MRKGKLVRSCAAGCPIESLEGRMLLSASVLRDLTPGTNGSGPTYAANLGNLVLFAADDGIHGSELWKTDGTPQGTTLVADINPAADPIPSSGFVTFPPSVGIKSVGGFVFFVGDDGVHGRELWRSDGTTAGTIMVRDIIAGATGSTPLNFTAFHNKLYFTVEATVGDRRLWVSDGTEAGTQEIRAGIGPESGQGLAVSGDALYFTADDGINGNELWRIAGSDEVMEMVADINPGSRSSRPVGLTDVNGTLFFSAISATGNNSLWKSGGTAQTTLSVHAVVPRPTNNPVMVNAGGTLFFQGCYQNECELWKSDGTTAGTGMVKQIYPGTYYNDLMNLTAVGNYVYFTAYGETFTSKPMVRIWRSDGTDAGTVQLWSQVAPGTDQTLQQFTKVGNDVYFRADQNLDFQLYKTDGTPEGTIMVPDLVPGPQTANPLPLLEFQGKLLMAARDADLGGNELWFTDGTAAGTTLIKDINQTPNTGFAAVAGSNPQYFVRLGDRLLFTANDSFDGNELFVSDGTAAGTHLLQNITRGLSGSTTANGVLKPEVCGNYAYFMTTDINNNNKQQFWVTDGTSEGTTLLLDLGAVSAACSGSRFFFLSGGSLYASQGTLATTVALGRPISPSNFSGTDGNLFFSAMDKNSPHLFPFLWFTDGTPANTRQLNINQPYGITAFKGKAYFTSIYTNGMWVSDGTDAGTKQFKAIGNFTFKMFFPAAANYRTPDRFYFYATGGTNGPLWTSDGTPNGTYGLGVDPGSNDGNPMIHVNGLTYFAGRTNQVPNENLFVTDGTPAGTHVITNLPPFDAAIGADGHRIHSITQVGGYLFFTYSGKIGTTQYTELWRTDGTAGGTLRLDRAAGYNYSDHQVTDIGGIGYFLSSVAGQGGYVLARTDGTVGGTVILDDISLASTPLYPVLSELDGKLIFPRRLPGESELWQYSNAPAEVTASGVLLITGTGAADSIVLGTANGVITVDVNGLSSNYPAASVSRIVISGLAGDDTLTFATAPGVPFNFAGGEGSDTITMPAASSFIDTDLGISTPGVALRLSGEGTARLGTTQHIGAVQLDTGARLDLGQYHLLIDNAPGAMALIRGYLQTGQLFSSTESQNGAKLILGYRIAGAQIEISLVATGDLNFDGAVTISDFVDLAAHFNQSTEAFFTDGDLNYDGSVTVADFIELAGNFGNSYSAAATPSAPLAASLTLSPVRSSLQRRHQKPRHAPKSAERPVNRLWIRGLDLRM